jgi:hypothetical protein
VDTAFEKSNARAGAVNRGGKPPPPNRRGSAKNQASLKGVVLRLPLSRRRRLRAYRAGTAYHSWMEDLGDPPGSSEAASDDEVLGLLKQARAYLDARAAGAAQPEPWSSALAHIDECVKVITTTVQQEAEGEAEAGSSVEAEAGGSGGAAHNKHCCSQETQTVSSPCHSTGTQACPTVASTSTGTGPRPTALGARNVALQENAAHR